MSATLYNTEILRLAASIPHLGRLDTPQGTVEKRSPICGSRIVADVDIFEGVVSSFAQEVRACALGQASAALLGAHVIGRTPKEVAEASAALTAYLSGERDDPGAWPGLDMLGAARAYSARHASIRLPFEAAAAAAAQAMER